MSSLKAPAKFIGSSSGTFKVANLYTRPFLLKQPYLPNYGQYNYQTPAMIPMMPPMGLTPLSNPPNFPVMQMPTGINSQIQNQQNKNN
jgi:hypothetical protein